MGIIKVVGFNTYLKSPKKKIVKTDVIPQIKEFPRIAGSFGHMSVEHRSLLNSLIRAVNGHRREITKLKRILNTK